MEKHEAWSDPEVRKKVQSEIDELREYATLAESIHQNQKSLKLGEAIERGFARLREVGAPEKAIIFTEYSDTQSFIAETLRQAGYAEGLVLFNGQNDSPAATAIYQEWLTKNDGSDVITGNPSADRRKALVDYFRDSGSIMIATEAASEGINLQFCSMLINYDLPWNPQRVEQRIGRIHRFGQKHDVVIVNFFNEGNAAEARILELLENKFHLFDSVFGASDEVLGRIENGFDFAQEIAKIYDGYRIAEEINQAFKELEEKYAATFSKDMAEAKAKVFDNLDPSVRDRLKSYDEQSGDVLNKFERLLLLLTIHGLQGKAMFEGDGRNFVLNMPPAAGIAAGHYHFKSSPSGNSKQYRYHSDLAKFVIDGALTADTPCQALVLDISKSDRVSSRMKELRRKATRADDPMEQLRFKKKARNLDGEIDSIEDQYRKEKRNLRDNVEELLILIRQSLQGKRPEKRAVHYPVADQSVNEGSQREE
ncbi:helicase-related protein [Corynebacterium macginleyi]|uniref:helicase-related protein n=1 Tax=Corynebacterium macginleyi TaxID=38290 RepID=UPI00217E02A4|nr:helicase-related protein [Corynebacterium macginleyi]